MAAKQSHTTHLNTFAFTHTITPTFLNKFLSCQVPLITGEDQALGALYFTHTYAFTHIQTHP